MTAAITDFTQYAELRHSADSKDPAALREVAGQFEALFLQSMLKSMRDASMGDPLFGDNEGHDMYRDMLDQQLSLEMSSGKGIGLAEMLVRQLGGEPAPVAAPADGYPLERTSPDDAFLLPAMGEIPAYPVNREQGPAAFALASRSRTDRSAGPDAAIPAAPRRTPTIMDIKPVDVPRASEPSPTDSMPGYGWADPASFARDLWPHAQRVANQLKVAPEAVMAQAALETGWGQHVMPRADGAISNNLFGIKASANWQGDSVARRTLEFADGVARQEVATFRTYDDVAGSFDDYATFLSENPRYQSVLENGSDIEGFARAIADSGYATDPDYAEKISRVANGELMNRVLAPLKNAPTPSITD